MNDSTMNTWARKEEMCGHWHWYERGTAESAVCGHVFIPGCSSTCFYRPDSAGVLCPDCFYISERKVRREKYFDQFGAWLFRTMIHLTCPALLGVIVWVCTRKEIDHSALFLACTALTMFYSIGWSGTFKAERTLKK